jgi:hydroxymethylpyrimidine/phosphomethylpyrimidine kinase
MRLNNMVLGFRAKGSRSCWYDMPTKKPPPPTKTPAPLTESLTDSDSELTMGDGDEEPSAPACVMVFNANDASGAGGLAGDVSTVAAMGAHPLPVVTAVVIRDTAQVLDHHALDDDWVVNQARNMLEDVTISGWKVGFLGNAENVSVVAEILADYPDVPLVSFLPNLGWMDDDEQGAYLEAFRELILPATEVLVGNQQSLGAFLLPDWDQERSPSARELAVAASERGARHVLVTGVMVPNKSAAAGAVQWIDNILASPEGALAGEKFERFDATFIGAGDTLAAALAALLASGADLPSAVSEALQFLDESLDAGFRPGMGNIVPDRFFWALPPAEDDQQTSPDGEGNDDASDGLGGQGKPASRRVH